MALSAADIQRLCKLAKVEVPEADIPRVQGDLTKILALFEQLKQVDTTGIDPLVHALELSDVLAADQVAASLTPDDVLKNAPSQDGSFFKVPPVLG